jgi:NTP pyrophosphatase (non-canonical NTP hydrolase)
VANCNIQNNGSILLSDYAAEIADTDVLDPTDISPILQGLYGEVGGIMSTAKKLIREKTAYPGYTKAAEEEFGDTLWYLAALCRRLKIPLDEIFTDATRLANFKTVGVASNLDKGGFAHVSVPTSTDTVDVTLFRLGRSAATLLGTAPTRPELVCFATDYLHALHAARLKFSDVARSNLLKARGAFLDPTLTELMDFDAEFEVEEQLPRNSASASTSAAVLEAICNGRECLSVIH